MMTAISEGLLVLVVLFILAFSPLPAIGQKNANKVLNKYHYIIGGSSTINGMVHYRGSRADFDFWSNKGATGWSYNEVLPFFIKSEDNRIPELRNSSLHGQCGPMIINLVDLKGHGDIVGLLKNGTEELGLRETDCNEEDPIGLCKVQVNVRSGLRLSTSKAYIRSNLGRHNLHVLTEAFVTKVTISRGNKRAFGVQFIRKGEKYYVRVTREIRTVANLPVGHNLKDHVAITVDIEANISSLQIQDLTKPEVALEYTFRRTGLYANQGSILNIFLDTTVQPRFNWPDVQVLVKDGINNNGANSATSESFQTDMQRGPEGYTSFVVALHTESKGIVKLKSKDPFVEPVIDPCYLERIEDVRNVINGLKAIRELVNTTAYRKANASLVLQTSKCPNNDTFNDVYLECLIRAKGISFNHMVSTVKMGSSSDKTTVVDPQLRVKGIKNLRVADASIMPEIPSSNTHAIVIMIAEKAATMVKAHWKTSC